MKKNILKKSRVLVIGAAGFTGRYFVKKLLDHDFEIHVVDKNQFFSSYSKKTKVYCSDLCENNYLEDLLDHIQPSFIVNLAGSLKSKSFQPLYSTNVEISHKLLRWAATSGKKIIQKLLLIGSAAEYGEPTKNPVPETANLVPLNFYGLTKKMQSELALLYVKEFSVPVVIARTFNLYGPGISTDLAVGRWSEEIRAAEHNGMILVGNLNTWRDYISINEAVDAYFNILFWESRRSVQCV